MTNNIDLATSFEKLMAETFPKYKGKTIEKLPTGFMVFSRYYATWEEATGEVDRAYQTLKKRHENG